MASNNNIGDYQDLFSQAVDLYGLDNKTANVLIDNLNATTMIGCNGADIEDLTTDDVTLVSFVLDMSPSMGPVQQEVIDSFNQMVKAFKDSKYEDNIIISAWVFDDKPSLLFGYTPVSSVKDLTYKEYQPGGSGTAIYDSQLNAMTGIVGYGQDLRNNGIRTKNIVIVFSDGEDNSSRKKPATVKKLAESLLKQESYILAFVGFGTAANFTQIANSTGYPTVLTVGHNASDIRRMFGQLSKSIIRSSQSKINANPNSFFI